MCHSVKCGDDFWHGHDFFSGGWCWRWRGSCDDDKYDDDDDEDSGDDDEYDDDEDSGDDDDGNHNDNDDDYQIKKAKKNGDRLGFLV